MELREDNTAIRQYLAELKQGVDDEDRLADLLHHMGECNVAAAVPVVARYLSHDSWRIRHMAIHVLLHHLRRREYAKSAWEMILNDPSDDVCEWAINGLSSLYAGTRNRSVCLRLVHCLPEVGRRFCRDGPGWMGRGIDKWVWQTATAAIARIMAMNEEKLWDRIRAMTVDQLAAYVEKM